MDHAGQFRILTLGNFPVLIRNLWDRVAVQGGFEISHLVHPAYDARRWPADLRTNPIYFFADDIRKVLDLPPGDADLLAALERPGVPTIHNMILSDRVVSTQPYRDALAYATFLAQRCLKIFESINPTVIIGSFDAIHNSIGLAVANQLGIPWVTPLYSALPGNEAALCSSLSPASQITFDRHRESELHSKADAMLAQFEGRKLVASAYVPPPVFSARYVLREVPRQAGTLLQVLRRKRLTRYLRFNEPPKSYSVGAMVAEATRLRKNLWLAKRRSLRVAPPSKPYVFFGLHMQPESSIDVFAHFFSNQERVIELMARSVPPTHSLLVKLHKSDTHNYSNDKLSRWSRYPGVELVSPYANTLEFIKSADLIFAIQGTIGLEGALFGRPVIMFGDSTVKLFPNVTTFGRTVDLPALIRQKLAEAPPARSAIIAAFAKYLAPYYPAVFNDWSIRPPDSQIVDFVKLIGRLTNYRLALDVNADA